MSKISCSGSKYQQGLSAAKAAVNNIRQDLCTINEHEFPKFNSFGGPTYKRPDSRTRPYEQTSLSGHQILKNAGNVYFAVLFKKNWKY